MADPLQPRDRRRTADMPLILMTGSSGMIGAALVKDLSRDYRVVGLDIDEPEKDAPLAEWIKCDLTKDEAVRDVLEQVRRRHGERVASVVHLAAYYDFSGEPSPMYDKLTVEGTRRLMRTLREQRFTVEQFIFSSSLLVMKPVENPDDPADLLTESSPTRAAWEYPRSKLDAEAALRQEHGDVPVVILRIAGVYTDECDSLPISHHIQRIFERQFESYVFPGNPDRGTPYLHLDDLAGCVRRAVERRRDLEPYELFLIAEPEAATHRELQDRLGVLIHGDEWPSIRVPKAAAKAGAWTKEKAGGDEFIKPWMIDLADDHYPVSIERAKTRLGWTPRRRLLDTLESMVAALRRDPQAWYQRHQLQLPDELRGVEAAAPEPARRT